jgi:hypothetical protein
MPCRKSVHLQVDLLTPIVSCMNPVSLHMGHNVPVIPWCWLLEHLPQSSAHSSPLSSSETSLAEAQRIILCALASYLAAHADGLSPPFCEYHANNLALFACIKLTVLVTIILTVTPAVSTCLPFRTWFWCSVPVTAHLPCGGS